MKEHGFAPKVEANTFRGASGTVREREEMPAELSQISAAVGKALQYDT